MAHYTRLLEVERDLRQAIFDAFKSRFSQCAGEFDAFLQTDEGEAHVQVRVDMDGVQPDEYKLNRTLEFWASAVDDITDVLFAKIGTDEPARAFVRQLCIRVCREGRDEMRCEYDHYKRIQTFYPPKIAREPCVTERE